MTLTRLPADISRSCEIAATGVRNMHGDPFHDCTREAAATIHKARLCPDHALEYLLHVVEQRP